MRSLDIRARAALFESLETRRLLSAVMPRSPQGVTSGQLSNLYSAGEAELRHSRDSQNAIFEIISSNLLSLYEQDSAGAQLSTAQLGPIESSDGIPAISVHAHVSATALDRSLLKLGLKLISVNAAARVVDGYLPISSLVLAARITGVTSISAIARPLLHSVGSAINQADEVLNVKSARSEFSVSGAGVKVGVISDSVGMVGNGLADSVASGDLPNNVHVLRDGQPGDTDEGRAMLEEIHDLAPGATLYFYSGDGSQDTMVAAVNTLKAAGCKVIVDDLGYPDEPMFQDGVISQAINSFVASGGSYFSAIGNDGDSGYLRTNLQYTTNADGTTWVNWADNKQPSGENLDFTVDGPVDIQLQWSSPYNGDSGAAGADLDLLVYNSSGTKLIASSTSDNLASGIPEESLNTLVPGSYRMRVQLVAVEPGQLPPTMLKFVAAEDAGGGLTSVEYPGIRSSAYGHGSGQNTISVGAVEFASAPPFSNSTPIRSETYSSTGPIIYAFNSNGDALSSPLTLDKPDLSGVDGVNTSFFGAVGPDDPTSMPQFYGTSAAAPNVAAIAALIDQFHPGAVQSQILAALKSSATPLNGAAAGSWNAQGGFGLVDATKALRYFGSSPVAPSAKLAAIASPRTGPVSFETITFNEPVTGFSRSALSLTRNGGSNLLTSSQILSTSDNIHFTLAGLSALTATAGKYVLTFSGSGSGISGDGIKIVGSESVSWQTNATVVGRHLFYNNSLFDGFNAAINSRDDGAIATNKAALLPDETASFANISSYYRGLNGIMIDVAGLPAPHLTASDFVFKTGNSSTISTWAAAPNPSSILVRPGAGVDGSTRIELVWPDHSSASSSAVAGAWLAVTLKADANTGLASSSLFFFGSAIGLTGVNLHSAAVTSADVAGIKAHESSTAAPVTSNWDITRNGAINATDATIAQANETSGSRVLQFIAPH